MPALSDTDKKRLEELKLPHQVEVIATRVWEENEYALGSLSLRRAVHPAFPLATFAILLWSFVSPEITVILPIVKMAAWILVFASSLAGTWLFLISSMRDGFDDEYDEVGKVRKILFSRGALEVWKTPNTFSSTCSVVLNGGLLVSLFLAGATVTAFFLAGAMWFLASGLSRLRKRIQECMDETCAASVMLRGGVSGNFSGNVYEGTHSRVA